MTNGTGSQDSRWQRMRRHGAFQAAVIFASAAWLGLQAADVFGLPTTAVRVLGVALLIVFVVLTIYAWLHTSDAGEGGARRRRTAPMFAAAVALTVLGALTWFLRPALFGGVKAGADVIAVLPFSTSGPDVASLDEGLVDLLSTNLNAVGPIRTVDPRTTLNRWRRADAAGGVDLDGSLAIGRDVGAGSVLVGSVVEAGNRVRLGAELFAVGGSRLAAAEVQGSADSVFDLVDQLSVALVRDIWRSREPVPELRLSALTTSSPSALRAYLAGEKFFRQSMWDSARASFEAATQEDSTFALAYARLSETYGWTESLGAPAARRASETAERFASRLPDRDRLLLIANRLHESGDQATVDSMKSFVRRYPDDAAGWFLLADAQYHARALRPNEPVAFLDSYDHGLELDPSFTPALEHPMEYAVVAGDTSRVNRYLAAMRAEQSEAQWRFYSRLAAVRFGATHEERMTALAKGLRGDARRGADFGRLTSAASAATLNEFAPDPAEVLAAYDSGFAAVTVPTGNRIGALVNVVMIAGASGRMSLADSLLHVVRGFGAPAVLGAVINLTVSGIPTSDITVPEWAMLNGQASSRVPDQVRIWLPYIAYTRNDVATARATLDALPSEIPGYPPQFIDGIRGLVRFAEGDTAGGLEMVKAAVRRTTYGSGSVAELIAFEALLLEIRVPATRQDALRRFDERVAGEPVIRLLSMWRLAKILEECGEYDRAAALLTRFIAIWEKGDPGYAPVVEEARRALSRVSAERPGR